MSRVGILTFSAGRDLLHQGVTSPRRPLGLGEFQGSIPPPQRGRSDAPAEDFSKLHLHPEATPDRSRDRLLRRRPWNDTLACLSRPDGAHRMQVTKGRLEVCEEKNRTLLHQSSLDGSRRTIFTRSTGDLAGELATAYRFLEIGLQRLDV